MLWFWTVRAAPRDTAPVAFALPPSPPGRKKPANLSLLQPTAALGLRHPGKKKTRDETGARSIDVVLKSAGPCPFGPPSSCRCRAALRVYLVCLVCSSLSFARSTGDRATSIEGSRGAESKKNFALVFGGGGGGLKKKKKKTGFLHSPRMDGPDGSRRAGAKFRNNFSGKLSEGSKHSQGDSQGG